MDTVTLSTKTGRRLSGSEADHGTKTHARINGAWKALCGTEPGKRADWSSYEVVYEYREACRKDNEITCEKCKRNLHAWSEKPRPYNNTSIR